MSIATENLKTAVEALIGRNNAKAELINELQAKVVELQGQVDAAVPEDAAAIQGVIDEMNAAK